MDAWIAEAAEDIAARAPAGARAARRDLVAVGRRRRRRGGDRVRGDARAGGRARRALAVLVGRPRRRPHPATLPGTGERADRPARARRHRSRPRATTARWRATASTCVGSGSVDMKGGDVLALGVLRALARAPRDVRRGRAAARLRRGVAGRRLRPHRALRRLGRVPVLRGRRADRTTATTPSSSSARPRARCASSRTGAPRTPARRPTRAPTRCWRSPAPRSRSRRCTTRRAPPHLTAVPTVVRCGDAFNVVPAAGELLCDLRADELRDVRHRARRAARERRRRPPRERTSCAAGRGWTRARRPRRCWRAAADAARPADRRRRPRRRQRRELPGAA